MATIYITNMYPGITAQYSTDSGGTWTDISTTTRTPTTITYQASLSIQLRASQTGTTNYQPFSLFFVMNGKGGVAKTDKGASVKVAYTAVDPGVDPFCTLTKFTDNNFCLSIRP